MRIEVKKQERMSKRFSLSTCSPTEHNQLMCSEDLTVSLRLLYAFCNFLKIIIAYIIGSYGDDFFI